MRSKITFMIVLLLALGLTADAGKPPTTVIEDLGWLAGHWRGTIGTTVVEESWLGPAGGTMFGVNRTVAGYQTVGFEFLRLENREGTVVLLASPNGRCPPTEFTLIELDGRRALFSNPEHDFPQQISYRREGTRLHAEIEGVDGGELKKAGCDFESVNR